MSSCISETAVQLEARRRVAEESAVARAAGLEAQKVYTASAAWKPHNNVCGGQTLMDVTAHMKVMGIENQ